MKIQLLINQVSLAHRSPYQEDFISLHSIMIVALANSKILCAFINHSYSRYPALP